MALTENGLKARRAYLNSPEQRAARRDYMRKWHKEHPGKNREYQDNYWNRKGEELAKNENDI